MIAFVYGLPALINYRKEEENKYINTKKKYNSHLRNINAHIEIYTHNNGIQCIRK